jgi:hypothetical protein
MIAQAVWQASSMSSLGALTAPATPARLEHDRQRHGELGDFNKDGNSELAWRRQDDTGEVRIWLLDGAGNVTKDIGLPAPGP